MIGDAVNTAARVAAATRETGDDVLITEATRSQLSDGLFEYEEREAVPMKGQAEPVELWVPREVPAAGGERRSATITRVGD